VAGTMNGLESSWADELERQRLAGEIAWWSYEPVTLKLAEQRCTYKPDFMVMDCEGLIEFHETKGYFEDKAKVKMKVASDKFPMFVFRLIFRRAKKDGGGFNVSVFGPEVESGG